MTAIQKKDTLTVRLDRAIAREFVQACRRHQAEMKLSPNVASAMADHLIHIGRRPVFDLDKFANLVHNNAVDKGWWDCLTCDGTGGDCEGITGACPTCGESGTYRDPAVLLALIHSEVSEALEAQRQPGLDKVCDRCNGVPDGTSCRKCSGTGELKDGRFAEEIADILIRLLDTARGLEVDLIKAAVEKHTYNVGRPRKHGKKF